MEGCRILHPEFRPRREEEEANEYARDTIEGKKPVGISKCRLRHSSQEGCREHK